MDVDSIAPGDDFVEILEGWVQQCEVLLALIGPRWLDSIDPKTNLRRLDNPEDFVRIEVRGALERKIPVVPVLLDAAGMPTAAELPDDIKALRRKHAEFVDFRTFDVDVQRLIKRLKIGKKVELPGEAPGPQAGDDVVRSAVAAAIFQRIKPDAVNAVLLAGVLASLLLVVGTVAYYMIAETHVDAPAGLADFAKSEEGRRTAEARANAATNALAKAEKARQEAEAKATGAVGSLAKSEESRRDAETRASAAEKARQEAEAKVAALTKAEELRKIADARPSPAPPPPAIRPAAGSQPSSSRKLLTDVGSKSRWAIDGNCNSPKDASTFSLEAGSGSITWVDGLGGVDSEKVVVSYEDAFYTTSDKRGYTRAYSRNGDSLYVQAGGRSGFTLRRCL
jgi:hypothetical protein